MNVRGCVSALVSEYMNARVRKHISSLMHGYSLRAVSQRANALLDECSAWQALGTQVLEQLAANNCRIS